MKALSCTGTRQLDYRDAPDLEPRADESLVHVAASGICGSDMHAWHGHDARRVPPMILGHELAGTTLSRPLADGSGAFEVIDAGRATPKIVLQP